MTGQSSRFFGCKVYDGPVFGNRKIGSFHDTFVKMSEIGEGLEIACLSESEVMRFYAVYVIHQHPAVFSDSFPYIGCFAASRFYIVPRIVVDISAVNRIRDRLAYAGAAFLRHIEEMILSVHLGNVSVDIRKIFGIVKEWFR